MLVKKAILKVGFANFLSMLSFFVSCTSLVIVARISSEYTQSKISSTKPVVVRNQNPVFITPEQNDGGATETYENVLRELEIDAGETGVHFDETKAKKTETAIREQNVQIRNAKADPGLARIDDFDRDIEKVSKVRYDDNEQLSYQKKGKVVLPIRAPSHVKEKQPAKQPNSRQTESVIKYNQGANSKSAVFESMDGKIVKVQREMDGDYRKVQIGTFETHSDAIAGWFRMKKEHRGTLDAFRYSIDVSTNDSGKKIFRLYIENESEDAAKIMCKDLKKKNIDCVVVK